MNFSISCNLHHTLSASDNKKKRLCFVFCLWIIIMLLLCFAITWTVYAALNLNLIKQYTNTKTPCSRVNNRTRVLHSVLFCDYIRVYLARNIESHWLLYIYILASRRYIYNYICLCGAPVMNFDVPTTHRVEHLSVRRILLHLTPFSRY